MTNSYQLFQQHEGFYTLESEGVYIGILSLEEEGNWSFIIDNPDLDPDECETGYAPTREQAAAELFKKLPQETTVVSANAFNYYEDYLTRGGKVYMTDEYFESFLAVAEEEDQGELIDLIIREKKDNGFNKVWL